MSKDHCAKVWSRMSSVEIAQLVAPEPSDDEDNNGTMNLGCMMSFEKGRCDLKDTENCVYYNPAAKGAENCSGIFHLEKVPDDF